MSKRKHPTLGSRLRQAREERGLLQSELAELADVSQSTISDTEADRSTPDGARLVRLARALGKTAEYLVDGKSETR